MAPTMLQDAPRPLQDGSQWPESSPRRPRRGQHLRTLYDMCLVVSPFRFRWPSGASRWFQDGPGVLQERFQRAPRRPQEHLIALQERPKSAPKGDCLGPRRATLTNARFVFDRCPPRWSQERS
eukprot:8267571-Pyramimonas_sp.AAC.1